MTQICFEFGNGRDAMYLDVTGSRGPGDHYQWPVPAIRPVEKHGPWSASWPCSAGGRKKHYEFFSNVTKIQCEQK